MERNEKQFVAFFFDSSKIDNVFYGRVVFDALFQCEEFSKNSCKMIFSRGDILNKNVYDDLNPFVIRDEFCTVSANEIVNGSIYVIAIEDIETSIANAIDSKLSDKCTYYVGKSTISTSSCDKRKQFWKQLPRDFSMFNSKIICFGKQEEFEFPYSDIADKYGIAISYDEEYSCEDISEIEGRQSSFVKNEEIEKFKTGRNDSDRGLLEMNFALAKETELAGVLIWNAIEEINREHISKDYKPKVDHIFMSFYQASQGIERLLKILIELVKYQNKNSSDYEKIDDLLTSHSHVKMYDYLKKQLNFDKDKKINGLLQLLNSFYNKARYNRYSQSDNDSLEIEYLYQFASHLKEDDFDEDFKNLYGKTLGKLTHQLYENIQKISSELNIYVYETICDSISNYALSNYYGDNLYSILKKLDNAKREVILYLLKHSDDLSIIKYLSDYDSLDFDSADINEYLSGIISNKGSSVFLLDCVEQFYEDLKNEGENIKERKEALNYLIGGRTPIELIEEC